MIFNHPSHRILTALFLIMIFFLTTQTFSFAAKKDKQKGFVMTEVELQSELMSYADRFASIITQAFELAKKFNRKSVTLVEKPNVLVLDEPTNHLDLEAIEQLEGLLNRRVGALVLVTHDPRVRAKFETVIPFEELGDAAAAATRSARVSTSSSRPAGNTVFRWSPRCCIPPTSAPWRRKQTSSRLAPATCKTLPCCTP